MLRIKIVDIALAQETHSDTSNEVDWKKEWDGIAILSHKTKMSAGVGIFFFFFFCRTFPYNKL